jgi:endonuclease/exonuclease/phosphatase family metal-dependent hydrolase
VSQLTPVAPELRAALMQGPFTPERHEAEFDAMPVLREIELGGAAAMRAEMAGPARLVFWNVERLRHLDEIAAHLEAVRPDVVLLSEVDRGMARTGNSDRLGMLSRRLDMGYLYAVEFVELGLGDVHEQRDHAGEVNSEGLHGAAILSDLTLLTPALVRIERRGDWFGLERHEPRVGSTIALLASIRVAGQSVLLANVHLESHDTPDSRGADMANLLRMIEELSPGGPVVIGGDFNTSTGSHAERQADPAGWAAKLAADPMRLLRPEPHEPLFAEAAARGYDWKGCNVPDASTVRYPAGSARRPIKIDWVFTRGVTASEVAILPATRADGSPASDHEGLIVSILPA